jgi:hypothetical protein
MKHLSQAVGSTPEMLPKSLVIWFKPVSWNLFHFIRIEKKASVWGKFFLIMKSRTKLRAKYDVARARINRGLKQV